MTFIIIAIVVVALSTIIIQVLKRKQFKKMLTLLQAGDFKSFEELVDAPLSRYLYPQFNLDYLRLNAYVIQNDEKKIEATLQKLLSYKISRKQKEDLYMKTFNYYVGVEKPGKAKEALDLVKTLDHPAMEAEAQRIYDIFMMKKSNYIDEMLEQYEMQDSTAKGVTAYLLSVQYDNKGEKINAKKYADISKDLMKEDIK
ncbi:MULTISPECIES: hypothetical protein [unclassified Breznakia]|uniref:hypothetical protein n=1 Tax=unclassified Breznakia TaxID=2623764 RepID=UPI00247613ED|nr:MULTISPECIES: hypothetical protein [unclassified Breznakia]MDH6366501.1 hypothetical protein [Breznakia sp. PH1-1]MDH6403594.1 hypothetical protein [Breznakia sp. PF1-11]MDH6411303.1 hypothetical protein [Breznakia sp. PFB1-11]MDH6413721.1 hypothetical protein [Breznakia sp. PFB1-14]MDH6415848.1 hypothetical protein [Breznakia sp. PFB1-4]